MAARTPPDEVAEPPADERYERVTVLGEGGAGSVVAARDLDTGRVVALKSLKHDAPKTERDIARFLREARVAAQLEHPNIVPVYDVCAEDPQAPFYTMRVVQRQSLQDVLASPELRKRWPLARLMGALVQVSRALAYAHRQGVVHRDIKPENILLGDGGEVYLSDWGNAKRLGQGGDDPTAAVQLGTLRKSGLSGTPGYIAPELLATEGKAADHRADLFSLGVVLYEVLTGHHPFDAASVLSVIVATQTRDPRPPRSIVPSCPLVLEDLCLAMLAKDPDRRPGSSDEVADEIESYLEGAKERARRRAEARRLCALAAEPVERDRALHAERLALAAEARRLLADVKGHEPIDNKRPGWELQDRAAAVEREQARAMVEAIDLYTRSLAYDPDLEPARRGLAELYWSRAVQADDEGREADRVYYEALVAEFDVGTFAALLKADGALSLETNPPGASVLVYRYVERDRVLVTSDERHLGRTPLVDARLSPGSYLLVLSSAGYRPVRLPVSLRRGERVELSVNLYTDEEIGPGFIYVPRGAFLAGGDREAPDALPRSTPFVEDFAISRFPVSFREYCDFLDDLSATDPGEAERRAPHDMRGSEGYAVRRADGGKWEPLPTIIEGDARRMFPIEDGHLWNVPVVLVDWFDAAAYCRYATRRFGFDVRLPTELEWEKAARGTDGRRFPWGDRFDPTFCHMRQSRASLPQPEPMGTFPTDQSPYGVRDMAGGMREWVGDVHGEQDWRACMREAEPSTDTERGESTWRVVRSGAWVATEEYSRCAARSRFFALTRGTGLGFRIARSLKSK